MQSSDVFRALHDIGVAVGGLRDPAHLARMVGEHARSLVGGDGVGLYLWNESVAVLQPLYVMDPQFAGPFPALTPGEGGAGQAFERRQAVLVTDYAKWEHALGWALECGVQQVAAVPLLVADRAIGSLAVRFLSAHNCTPEHADVLTLVAAQVAPALEAALLRVQAERQRARLAATLEHLPVGVVVLDEAGKIISLNAEGRRLSGIGPDHARPLADQAEAYELRDVRTGKLLTPDETPAARALRGEEVLDIDYAGRPPGVVEDRYTRVSAVPVRDPDGVLIGAVSIFSDITRERRLVAELATTAHNNARLARELADREQRLRSRLSVLFPPGLPEPEDAATLSERERQVLGGLARGWTNREIGKTLGISTGTVRKHVEHILTKLQVADRTQAAVMATELRLIEP